MRRLGPALVSSAVALLVIACSTSPASQSTPGSGSVGSEALVSASPPESPTAPATTPATTPAPTPTPVSAANCPTGELTVVDFVEHADSCFAGIDVTIRAWLADPPAMGWEGPSIEPAWLAYPPDIRNTALWPRGPGGSEMCDGSGPCQWFFVHLPPGSAVELGRTARWVIVTGHILDPRAETCHYVYPDPILEPTPADEDARSACRTQFVVTSLHDAS